MGWEQVGVLVGVFSPLVGVPMTLVVLFLRGIRETQLAALNEISRRIDRMEARLEELARFVSDVEREYATKEEWLRESMLARQRLDRLGEAMARAEAEAAIAARRSEEREGS